MQRLRRSTDQPDSRHTTSNGRQARNILDRPVSFS